MADDNPTTAPRKITKPIKGAKIVTMRKATGTYPALSYRGDVPKVGTKLRATLDNGVTYSGLVADVVEVDGELLVEFRDGLSVEGE